MRRSSEKLCRRSLALLAAGQDALDRPATKKRLAVKALILAGRASSVAQLHINV